MNRSRAVVGMLTAAIAILGLASPAGAQFSSVTGKATEGESDALGFSVKTGSAHIGCVTTSTTNKWAIENEKEKLTKGPILALKISTWGECGIESKSKSTKATLSECELQVTETKEEVAASFSVGTTCTLKAENEKKEMCEDKIEPGSNKGLKSVNLSEAGSSSENTVLEFGVTGVSLTAGKACESLGLLSTKEGEITGGAEMLQVRPQLNAPTFLAIRTGAIQVNNATEKRKVTISNTGALALVQSLAALSNEPARWLVFNFNTCKTHEYESLEGCIVEPEKQNNQIQGLVTNLTILVISPNNGRSSALFLG